MTKDREELFKEMQQLDDSENLEILFKFLGAAKVIEENEDDYGVQCFFEIAEEVVEESKKSHSSANE